MKLGVIVYLTRGGIEGEFKKVRELGFDFCQLGCWETDLFNEETADCVLACIKKYNITVSSLWCGWTGPCVWDFYEGPVTLGIVPEEHRPIRIIELMQGADFAKMIGVKNIITHVGFLPEVANSEQYRSVVSALKPLALHIKNNGQKLLFETGQETPVTLVRTIEDIGTGNLGINLDPANLILYGKANPVDSVDLLGKYICDVHAKDGCYPTDSKHLGNEMPIGQGQVNFPELIKKLKNVGYDGTIIIEREISGDEQIRDIIAAKEYLETLIA